MRQSKISPDDLICMNDHKDTCHFRIDLAYAHDNNLLFGERIYRTDASLWLYNDLAHIVQRASQDCFKTHGLKFVLYDGLRTVEAQERMLTTQRVKDNPHWLEPPRLLSTPGYGGHPRGMAIDIGLETLCGTLLDMGCAFDALEDAAHRDHSHPPEVKKNRDILDSCMRDAANALGIKLFPLPQEWWDFRLPPAFYDTFAPLHDTDLPKHMVLL